ncbi:MAG: hypothetical protein AAFX07_00700 [Pseudomonadota bacterium]
MKPIPDKIMRLRQRQRANGTWRIWWEPEKAVRARGFEPVELDADRPSWSVRQAERLNRDVSRSNTDTPRSGGRTIGDLIERYTASRKFRDLPETTQASYRKNLKLIDDKWGNQAVAYFTKSVMHTWYETLFEHSGQWQAKALIRMMSVMFSYAELIGWRQDNSNPCFRLGMKQPAGRKRTASWAELDALTAAADDLGHPAMALAVLLSALQGQRQTDVRLARAQDFDQVTLPAADGRDQETIWIWYWTRSKRQNAGIAPIHAELQPRLSAALDAHPVEFEELLIDAATGRPLSADLFQKRWAKVRDAAAKTLPSIAGLQFRDLRRTFGNFARAGGASIDDTADVLGNSAATSPALREVYMASQLDTSRRAIEAIKRPKDEEEKRA